MHTPFRIGLGLLLLLVTSCIHEPPCDLSSKDDNIELIPLWPDVVNRPPRILVQCYPEDGGLVVQNFIPPEGGRIYLSAGTYNLLLYSSSATISFRNMEMPNTAEAYVENGNQPDYLYTGNVAYLTVNKAKVNKTIEVPMQDLVYNYPFVYTGLKGLQYVDRITITINGLNQGVKLYTRTPTDVIYTASCPYTLTQNGLQGTLRCFGHGDAEIQHSFVVRFEYGQQTLTRTYDVTHMLNEQGYIHIQDNLVFKPSQNGGIDTGVGDWGDDVVDVPIN